MRSEQPFMQRDMRALVQCAHSRRERLLAWAALVEAGASAFALEFCSLIHSAAMRADWPIRPAEIFEMNAGGGFVGENLVGKVACHGQLSFWPQNYNLSGGM
jgi:hypothetical protein